MRKFGFEMAHAPVVGAELLLERGPLDEGGPVRVDAMQPLRQPCVEVERQGGMSKRRKIGLVKRHGVFLQAVEVVEGKLDRRGPQDALPLVQFWAIAQTR